MVGCHVRGKCDVEEVGSQKGEIVLTSQKLDFNPIRVHMRRKARRRVSSVTGRR